MSLYSPHQQPKQQPDWQHYYRPHMIPSRPRSSLLLTPPSETSSPVPPPTAYTESRSGYPSPPRSSMPRLADSHQTTLPPLSSIVPPSPISNHSPTRRRSPFRQTTYNASQLKHTPTRLAAHQQPTTSASSGPTWSSMESLTPEATRRKRARTAEFVARNTSAMICYLWFGRSSVSATQARLQFVPTPAFVDFIQNLLTTTQVSQSVIVLSLHYIYKLKTENPEIDAMAGSEMRLAVAALMLANKFLDDNTYTNLTWSQISNISLTEINLMEREFLQGVGFNLYVNQRAYDGWLKMLNGLMWAKEREYEGWRRTVSTTLTAQPQYQTSLATPPSLAYYGSPRARSTSPTHAPSAYPFTFNVPSAVELPNPFAKPLPMDMDIKPEPISPPPPPIPTATRPTAVGSKRSAVDAAFSPDVQASRPSKRPLSAVFPSAATSNWMDLVLQPPVESMNRVEPAHSLGAAMGRMSLDPVSQPLHTIKVEDPDELCFSFNEGFAGNGNGSVQQLAAPYHADERLTRRGPPKYLTFNTLVASPSAAEDESYGSVNTYGYHARASENGHYHIQQQAINIPPPSLPPPVPRTQNFPDRKTVTRYQMQHLGRQGAPFTDVFQVTPQHAPSVYDGGQANFANAGPPGWQWNTMRALSSQSVSSNHPYITRQNSAQIGGLTPAATMTAVHHSQVPGYQRRGSSKLQHRPLPLSNHGSSQMLPTSQWNRTTAQQYHA